MRVYEFSKDHGVSSKELIQILKENNFEVTSHMAVLPHDAVNFLEKYFNKKQDVKKIKSCHISRSFSAEKRKI